MSSSSSSPRYNNKNTLSTDRKTNLLDADKMKTVMEGEGYMPSSEEEKTSKELKQEEERLSDNSSSDEEDKKMKEYNGHSSDEGKMSKQESQSFNAEMQLHQHGIIDLPLGYRFCPANHELIKPYLYNKILGMPADPHPIKDINLSNYDANDIPFDENCKPNETYFYTCLHSVLRVVTKSGYWEVTGGDVPVYSDKEEKVMVGFKKNWVFYWGEPPTGKKSLWSMSEFRINPRLIPNYQQSDNLKFKMVNYVVCKIKKQLL